MVAKGACISCGLWFCKTHRKDKSALGRTIRTDIAKWPDAGYICDTCCPKEQEGVGMVKRAGEDLGAGIGDGLRTHIEVALASTRAEVSAIVRESEASVLRIATDLETRIDRQVGNAKTQVVAAGSELELVVDRVLSSAQERIRTEVNAAVDEIDHRLRKIAADVEAQTKDKGSKIYVLTGVRVALVTLSVVLFTVAAPRLYQQLSAPVSDLAHLVWNAMAMTAAALFLGVEFLVPGLRNPSTRKHTVAFMVSAVVACIYVYAVPT